MNQKRNGAILFFGLAVMMGLVVGRTSWKGAIYLTSTSFTSNSRTPAAVHRDLDFTKLDGAELVTQGKTRLVSEAKLLFEKGEMGVEFGHFVTRDAQGNRQLACEFYDSVRVRFEAEGVANAGEKPTMEIEAPCKTGTDITRIEPVWIPVMSILNETPNDMDLTFSENEGVKFKFSHMDGQWPRRWNLTGVKLFNGVDTTRQSVTFDPQDLRGLRAKPLFLAWPKAARMPTNAD